MEFLCPWEYLISVVENPRRRGRLIGAMNSTFLNIIPKKSKPTIFSTNLLMKCCIKIDNKDLG